MTIILSDNFDDTNAGTSGTYALENHAPQSPAGASWIPANPNNKLVLFYNASSYGGILSTGTNYGGIYESSVANTSDDITISLSLKLLTNYNPSAESAFVYGDAGVMLRATHTTDYGSARLYTGYLVYYRYKDNSFRITRLSVNTTDTPGTPFQVSTDLYTLPAPTPLVKGAASRTFDISISGTTITIYEGTTQILSYTDVDAAKVTVGKLFGTYIKAVSGNDPYIDALVAKTNVAQAANPPTFSGTIADITGTGGAAITPVDVHSSFSSTVALTYSASPGGTAWPSGLVINSTTGVISGTVADPITAALKVRATDTSNQTVDSNAFNITINAFANPSAPGAPAISGLTYNGVTGTWTAASAGTNPVAGYEYSIDTANPSWNDIGNVLTKTVTGTLAGNTLYNFRVRSYDNATTKNYSTVVTTQFTTPAAPVAQPVMTANPTASNVTATGMTINWTAANAGTYPVAGYQVSLDTGTANWVDVGNTLSKVFTSGLSPNTQYTARVRAYDNEATPLYSAAVSILQSTPAVVLPGNPSAPTASNVTATSATVSWAAAVAGTYPIAGYKVSVDTGTAAWADVGNVLSVPETLQPNTAYTIRVQAYDTQTNVSGIVTGTILTPASTSYVDLSTDKCDNMQSGLMNSVALTAVVIRRDDPTQTKQVVTGLTSAADGSGPRFQVNLPLGTPYHAILINATDNTITGIVSDHVTVS